MDTLEHAFRLLFFCRMSSSQSLQVAPLPLSSGGPPTQTQKDMEKTNTTLTMLLAQSKADATFDPPPPAPLTAPRILEGFRVSPIQRERAMAGLFVGGVLFMLYGIMTD